MISYMISYIQNYNIIYDIIIYICQKFANISLGDLRILSY